MLEAPSAKPLPANKNQYLKYTLVFQAGATQCEPFVWTAWNSSVFGVRSDFPIFNKLGHTGVKFFPCALKNKVTRISWYQKKDSSAVSEEGSFIDKTLWGHFVYAKTTQNMPNFYFGKNFIPQTDFRFLFPEIAAQDAADTFFVPFDKTDAVANQFVRSFSLKGGTQAAFFVSPI
jgi:hypothetical protein